MGKEQIEVQVFCDYEATLAQGIWGYPLYCDDEDDRGYRYFETFCTLCEEDVVVLNELIHWNMQYDICFPDFERALEAKGDWDKSVFDPDKFTETGKNLAFRVKCNHPDWEVRFYDEVAHIIAWYAEGRHVDNETDTYWYSVRISSEGERLLLPLSERRGPDGTREFFLPGEERKR